ncbi:MAG TPA: recombinase family protein [Caldisericia bacterium]|jgi:site-specific DNA recombinase|nr:recombinase family protein [Caldisericia bacterium]
MKAAAYIRVSTEEQLKGFGLEVQKERIHYYAKFRGINIKKWYEDSGISAKTTQRPGLQLMIQDIKKNKYDALIVYKLDRLSRSLRDLLNLLEDSLNPYKCEFISVTEQFDTSVPQGKLMIQLLGSFAEFERNLIVERTWNGKMAKAQQGGYTGGEPPYGFKAEGKQLVLDPEKITLIKRIIGLRKGRHSYEEIAKTLNQEAEFFPKRGKQWYAKSIYNMVHNKKYYQLDCES